MLFGGFNFPECSIFPKIKAKCKLAAEKLSGNYFFDYLGNTNRKTNRITDKKSSVGRSGFTRPTV